MGHKIRMFRDGETEFRKILDSHQGWKAYAKWANTYKLQEIVKGKIIDEVWERV